jgi:hypothetical protein
VVSLHGQVINRTQGLVLAFFLLAWLTVITILAVAPEVYGQTLRRAPGSLGMAEAVFVAGVSALIGLVSVGVVRRWRWVFWLILVVFFAGIVRIPVAGLQLSGRWPADGPAWYLVLQAVAGTVQFAIALTMLAGYRRSGVWGDL